MKPLKQNEIFQNLSGFLKTRGIELKEGSYATGVQKSCALLTNAINLGQESFERAKVEFDKSMEHMRRVIHEKTAPKAPPVQTSAAPPPTAAKGNPRPAAAKKPLKRAQPRKPAKKSTGKGRA